MSPIIKDIQADSILPDLKAGTARQVMQMLAAEASLHEAVDPEILYDELVQKEHNSPSGIGGGVAIMHLQVDTLQEPFIMLARLQDRVDYNAIDQLGVDLVVLLLSPERDGPVHLRRLSRLSRLFRNEQLCADLRAAKDAHAMRALLRMPEVLSLAA